MLSSNAVDRCRYRLETTARLIAVGLLLRAAGLHALLGCDDAQRVAVPPYDDRRDQATGVLNPDGIAEVARSVAGIVESALQASRLPVVLGGDCSILLGPLLALRRRGRYGLVFLDGHADFQHPADEPNGEVASLDLALAAGRGPRPLTDLDGLAPLVRAEDVALVGYRVFDDNDRFGTEHVRDSGITVLDYQELRAGTIPLILDRALATVTRPGLQGFWVHLDVDVLDDAIMPAVDYRHPGGLSWDEAAQLLQGLLSRPGALGLDGYYTGETLRLVRGTDGTLDHLDLGSFVFTREPYGPDGPLAARPDPEGWRAFLMSA